MIPSFQPKFLFMTDKYPTPCHSEQRSCRGTCFSLASPENHHLVVATSSCVVTETIEPRVISSRKLSGGTRRCTYSSFTATIIPCTPPLGTTLSPVLTSPSMAC